MHTCREIIQILIDYLEGDLSPAEKQHFEEHMDACPPCHAFLRTYEKSGELARAALQPSDLPDELQERVRGFLRHRLGLIR